MDGEKVSIVSWKSWQSGEGLYRLTSPRSGRFFDVSSLKQMPSPQKHRSCCKDIRPQNSARYFKNPAPVLGCSRVRKLLGALNGGNVLEIGGGCLRNALYLQGLDLKVSVLEVQGMRERFPLEYRRFEDSGGRLLDALPRHGLFDLAIATFVIETICEPSLRIRIISRVRHLLKPAACLILSVRGPSDLVTAQNKGRPCSDGYITPSFTFSRSYTRSQLQHFLSQCHFSTVEFLHKKTTKEPELLHALAWRRES